MKKETRNEVGKDERKRRDTAVVLLCSYM